MLWPLLYQWRSQGRIFGEGGKKGVAMGGGGKNGCDQDEGKEGVNPRG